MIMCREHNFKLKIKRREKIEMDPNNLPIDIQCNKLNGL
jgi:hypothetical protein